MSWWFGSASYLTSSEYSATVKLPIQPKHCKSICDLFGLPVTGCEWEDDCGLPYPVSFAVGSCKFVSLDKKVLES